MAANDVDGRRHEDCGRTTHARILVAEDDAEMRRLVAEALKRDQHDVVEVEDGARMIAFLAEIRAERNTSPVDLIVSDIRMPGCGGLDLLEALQHLDWGVPVILMTAFGDDETLARVSRLGALLFEKPFPMRDLRAAVQRALSARK